jgi:hypothetical protein
LNCCLFKFGGESIVFDEFIRIIFPYKIKDSYHGFLKLNFPIKYHKQPLKYKEGSLSTPYHNK